MPDFTQDWFTCSLPNFRHIASLLPGCRRILEIGCFEGRATCWMLQNMLAPTGSITCVDTFEGGSDHKGMDFSGVRKRFLDNTREVKKPHQELRLVVADSYKAIASMLGASPIVSFDFIYIDGSHEAADVLTDGVMAFRLLKHGGVILFDDYLWGEPIAEFSPLLRRPKIAIDAFSTIFSDQIETVICGFQGGFRRK